MSTILFLVGSNRSESLNVRLAHVAATQVPAGYNAEFFDIFSLPFFNDDLKGEDTPTSVTAFRAALTTAAGVFIVTPEYNYSVPGVVKNAIDWASRPMLPRHSIVGKPMNAAVATMSATNGIRCLVDLKRMWGVCSGVPVQSFDFVLQQAASKFVESDKGDQTLEPVSLATLQFALANLERLIDHNAAAAVNANWDAFVANLS